MKKNKVNYHPTADTINKKIETIQKNIIAENKKAIPSDKTITRLIDRQIKLENELQAVYSLRTDVLMTQKAKQCVYTALRTIVAKRADQQLQEIMYSIWSHSDIADTLPDAQELINIANLAIMEASKKSSLSLNSFLETGSDFYEMPYREFRNKKGQRDYHTPYLYAITRVNKFITAQKSNKGRKTISHYETVKQPDCITYDGAGNIKHIDTFDAEKVAVKQGYALELISLNSLQDNTPENYERLSVQYDIKLDCEYVEEEQKIMGLLAKKEREIAKLLLKNYSISEIQVILNGKQGAISTLRARIKEKIANSGMYDNYDIVKAYKTK